MIIHTATGRHLQELQARFADVGCVSQSRDLSEPIENLLNLGPTSSGWLREAGMGTIADLQRLGPTVAYQIVRARQPKASLNLLWALAAGLRGLDWRALTAQEKDELRGQLDDRH